MTLTIVLFAIGLLAFVRFSPVDPAKWHIDLAQPGAKGRGASYCTTPTAGTRFQFTIVDPATVLRTLDTIVMATPRTSLLMGSPESGQMSWVTRSQLMGFPDITTAQVMPSADGLRLCMLGRQRFGTEDFGVNARRIEAWAMELEGRVEPPEANPL